MSFSVIHDLWPLTNDQRQQYLRDASQYFGLDPDLNAIDLISMNNTDGQRRLIAYARRGTTDILREIHQINVLSVTMQSGPGFVSFTAIGKSSGGRQEIAVGAAGTDGLKGDKLAAAIATAQTRALRRMTLQFIGGGLLDESEIGDNTTTDINRLGDSLSSVATVPVQPVVEVNTQAGRDATLDARLAAGEKGVTKIPDSPDTRHAVAVIPGNGSIPHGGIAGLPSEALQAPIPFSAGSIIPTALSLPAAPPVEEPKKRKRRTKDEIHQAAVNLAHDAIAAEDPTAIKILEYAQQLSEAVPEELGIEPTHHEPFIEIGTGVDEIVEELEKKQYPTDEQDKAFRARLSVFTNSANGVLKTGGMTDGVIWRVRKYTTHLCPDALIEGGKMKLTVAEWTKLLFALEGIYKSDGANGLVQTINEVAEKA